MPNELGEWWPVIFAVSEGGVCHPAYCPGLAWQNARPWFAHTTRLAGVENSTGHQELMDELSENDNIEDVWELVNSVESLNLDVD